MKKYGAVAEQKETKTANSGVKTPKTCQFCGHCQWIIWGKTNEFYCIRMKDDGTKVAVFMTGREPENCSQFVKRSNNV